jgi:hypothetical protein
MAHGWCGDVCHTVCTEMTAGRVLLPSRQRCESSRFTNSCWVTDRYYYAMDAVCLSL